MKNKKGVGVGRITRQGGLPHKNDMVDLLETVPIKAPKVSPAVKTEIKKKIPAYIDDLMKDIPEDLALEESGDPASFKSKTPDQFMKHMDSTFESFFYQRDYTLKNFCFYLQVLSHQQKKDDALVAFRRMEQMGIRPNDTAYNYLMLNFAKDKDLAMVLKLEKEAVDKYSLPPSKFRYNNLVLCYAKMN